LIGLSAGLVAPDTLPDRDNGDLQATVIQDPPSAVDIGQGQ
jgi:hypothetical protein